MPPDRRQCKIALAMANLSTQHAFDLAIHHHRAGRLKEAEALYLQILDQQPENPDALHLLGLIAHQTGRNNIAIDLIQHALARKPNFPDAWNNLGLVLEDARQLDGAAQAFRQTISHDPRHVQAHYNLGVVLRDKGDIDSAFAAFMQTLAVDPTHAKARNNLGVLLLNKERFDDAIAVLHPLIQSNPNYADPFNNLASALMDTGRVDEAIAAYKQAIGLAPTNAEFHHNFALALLASGRLQQGWDEYEWRLQWKGFPSTPRTFSQPRWDGTALDGRTLLLHAEQGFGDAIQFVRYLPMLAAQPGKIIFECPPELVALFQPLAKHCTLITQRSAPPPFDVHCPLLSLPRIFKTTLESIPADVPYLFPDPSLIEHWRSRLNPSDSVLKVGLAWAGNPTQTEDRNRSISLSQLSTLSGVAGVRFYSLQKGDAAAQAKSAPPGLDLVDWSEEFHNFSDAGLIANLDLVITVDTAIAHLAGALGKPVWLMLRFMPDWRWLLGRDDTPWYPTMRLFRQQSRGDWSGVVARVAAALAQHAAAKSCPRMDTNEHE